MLYDREVMSGLMRAVPRFDELKIGAHSGRGKGEGDHEKDMDFEWEKPLKSATSEGSGVPCIAAHGGRHDRAELGYFSRFDA